MNCGPWSSYWIGLALALPTACSPAQGETGPGETGQGAVGQDPEPAATVTDAKDRTPSDFARFEQVDDGGHFDVAITTYRNGDGQQVVLFGAVHIADKAHYEELQRRFAGCDVLLYELVGPEDYRPVRGESRGGFVSILQNAMKSGLELEFQLDGIDYQQDNFVHADMTPEEMADSMEERGETLFGMLLKLGMQSQKAMLESGAELQGMDFDLVRAFRDGEGRHRLRLMMASQLEMLEAMTAGAGEAGSTLLEGRNEKCLEVLQRELKQGHERLGIYYGAAHLPHLERRLVDDLGFAKVDHEWLVAWDCTPRKDPVVDRELWAQRRQAKSDIAAIELAIGSWRFRNEVDKAGAPTFAQLAATPDDGGAPLYTGTRTDPWGNEYRITAYPRMPYFDVHSYGQDEKPDTDDDIHSASERRLEVMRRAAERQMDTERSRGTRARDELEAVRNAAVRYREARGQWPTFAQLVEPDGRGNVYLLGIDKDPWGRAYQLRTLADGSLQGRSAGPDGRFDTVDDIVNPAPR